MLLIIARGHGGVKARVPGTRYDQKLWMESLKQAA